MVEINDDACEMYNTNNQRKVKTKMLRWTLCDQSNAYTLVTGTFIVVGTDASARKSNTQVDNKKDLDVVMEMCYLLEYINNYSKTNRILF